MGKLKFEDTVDRELILEEPLSIRVEGEPYAVVMRTPGEEIAHAAGFCLSEGLVEQVEDFATIAMCSDEDLNVVTVTLAPQRRGQVEDLLERRGFVSQTSCGICGKELIKDIHQAVTPVSESVLLGREQAVALVGALKGHQALYEKTGAAHGAIVIDREFNVMAAAEDVGRHNALDKAIGKVFMEKKLNAARIVVLSSRISYELVQKAARAQVEVIIGMSRPTALAVDLARRLNISVATVGKKGGFSVFCGQHRFPSE
jgi:FdhD protein